VLLLALGAAFFLAMRTEVAVTLLRANAASLHNLAAGGIRQFPRDFDVQLEEALKRHVGGKGLHALRISV
jgi:hypothetical protein